MEDYGLPNRVGIIVCGLTIGNVLRPGCQLHRSVSQPCWFAELAHRQEHGSPPSPHRDR